MLELDFIVGNSRLSSVAVGFGGIEGALNVGIIEGGQQLALGDPRAFIEENPGDAAGNLGSNGGPPAWRNVPAGIQQRLAPPGIGLRVRYDFHDRFLTSQSIVRRPPTRESADG